MHPHLSSVVPKRAVILLGISAVGWILGACGSSSTQVAACAAAPSMSVVIVVRDSTTGLPEADGAVGTLVGGTVDDTLTHVDSLTIRGGDQTGTFDVTIDKAGYARWTATGVHVTQVGECGNVIPAQLLAQLQATAP